MSDSGFGFFTAAGEDLARKLIKGIVADVSCDRTSRRRALDRIAEAVERAAGTDGMQADQDCMDAIAAVLNPAFHKAGFMPVSGIQLRGHCEDWSRKGAAAGSADVCPAAVLEAASAARTAGALLEQVGARRSVGVGASALAPYEPGFFDAEGYPPGEIVLFPWRGETGGESYMGCVLVGDSGCAYLEDVVSCGAAKVLHEGLLGAGDARDSEALGADLVRLHAELARFNVASALVREPARLTVRVAEDGAGLETLWDGDPLPGQSARPAVPGRRVSAPLAVADALDTLGFEGGPVDEPAAPAMR